MSLSRVNDRRSPMDHLHSMSKILITFIAIICRPDRSIVDSLPIFWQPNWESTGLYWKSSGTHLVSLRFTIRICYWCLRSSFCDCTCCLSSENLTIIVLTIWGCTGQSLVGLANGGFFILVERFWIQQLATVKSWERIFKT